MIPILNKRESFQLDTKTIETGFLSQKNLMNNAGREIAQFIIENINNTYNHKFIIIAGPGNNGGDGVIAYYYLCKYGVNTNLIIVDKKNIYDWIFDTYRINNENVNYYNDSINLNPNEWYIDAIFGIGLNKPIKNKYKNIIKDLSKCKNIISIDTPSGIFCDTGLSGNFFVKSKFILTMNYPKVCYFFNDGYLAYDNYSILDIGLIKINTNNYIKLIESSDIESLLPQLSKIDDKYKRGRLLLICGSLGNTGAAILAAKAAMRSGVGILKLIVPESTNNIYESCLNEAITLPLPKSDIDYLSNDNFKVIKKSLTWSKSVLIGPGLISPCSNDLGRIIKSVKGVLVLDASGFRPIIDNIITIDDLPKKTILTPHYYEFSKIFNFDINNVLSDPIKYITKVKYLLKGRVLILKGPNTIIVSSSGEIYIINNASDTLATAGTGDILSGIISSLTAQNLNIDNAAILGVYLLGECSNLFDNTYSGSIIASDFIDKIGIAFKGMYG